ncbi:MAG TPA: HAD-IIB family hydrolase [Polyangiaceae bacterium]|nr:HAD-IIB family hydrolase [Polyangiaceae bacterium]
MRYLALATDYDGTLAEHGAVDDATLSVLRRLRDSGRRLILVSGRELPDLLRVFPKYEVFHRIVAENGALVFNPETREEKLLGKAPPARFADTLREHNVTPLSTGKVIVATWAPHQTTVLNTILELGLELQVIFNKGAVMVLPSGINKASGLQVALADLGISVHNTVAVGDAENDHALLDACELRVAVANAVPTLKDRADWVTLQPRGAGVIELAERLLENDLNEFSGRLARSCIEIGTFDQQPVSIPVHGKRVLICGTSGSGKSSLACGFLERLVEKEYQFCLIDPEGDFEAFPNCVVIGGSQQIPAADEVISVLTPGEQSVICCLLGVPLEARPRAFVQLLARLEEHRAHFGRPHWIVADEAHHFMPGGAITLPDPILNAPTGLLLITVHPEHLATRVLQMMNYIVATGEAPAKALRIFAQAHGLTRQFEDVTLETGEALLWEAGNPGPPIKLRPIPPQSQRRRHQRKYALGQLGEDKSFYFRGPREALNLRAHNLAIFVQIADGVDDETWSYHLRRHDYSKWLENVVKDDSLASEVLAIETDPTYPAALSRGKIRNAILTRYTFPA